MRAILVVAALLVLLFSPAALGQPSPKLPGKIKDVAVAQADLKAYQSALRTYREGDESAVLELLAWDERRVRDAVSVINTSLDDTRPWALDDIKAAVLMHTEAVTRLQRSPERDMQAGAQLELATRVLVRGADPQLDRPDSEAEQRHAEVRAFASRWYVAVSRFLRDQARFNVARNFLALGRERLPRDPAVLYESGTMEEYVATFPSEKLKREMARHMTLSTGETVIGRIIRRHSDQLSDAERWLRESMRHDAHRLDTQLHLGRVLMLLGRDEEASRVLENVAAAPAEYSYLAQMFRGAIEERRGALDAAAEAYRRAAAINGGRQSAAVALSQVLRRQGRGDQSRAVLEELLADPPVARDPWWSYFFDEGNAAAARLERVFAELAR